MHWSPRRTRSYTGRPAARRVARDAASSAHQAAAVPFFIAKVCSTTTVPRSGKSDLPPPSWSSSIASVAHVRRCIVVMFMNGRRPDPTLQNPKLQIERRVAQSGAERCRSDQTCINLHYSDLSLRTLTHSATWAFPENQALKLILPPTA